MWLNCEGRSPVFRSVAASLALAAALGLSACAEEGPRDPIGLTAVSHGVETGAERQARLSERKEADSADPWFAGAAIADEPSAALIAREVLEQGGNAADAASAVYFGLSVTYPAAAGLGGGGICLVHEAGATTVDTVSFLTRTPRGGGAIAVPGNVRGFAYIHSRYGSLPWGSIVAPAERLAATGIPVSRASAAQFAAASSVISGSPALKAVFATDGGIAKELDVVTRIHQAATLAQVRSKGVGGFYSGPTARRLVETAAQAGGALDFGDLRDYRPVVSSARMVERGTGKVWLPSEEVGAGAFGTALWSAIQNASPGELAAIAETTATRLGAPAGTDRDYGSTSFVAIDGKGGAVACAVSIERSLRRRRRCGRNRRRPRGEPVRSRHGPCPGLPRPGHRDGRERRICPLHRCGQRRAQGRGRRAVHGDERADRRSCLECARRGPADARSSVNGIVCPDGIATGACALAINPRGNGMGVTGVAAGN